MKTKHHWVGFQYDSTICNHCHIDRYEFPTIGEYCEDVETERAAWKESKRTKPARTLAALNKARSVLTEEEYMLLNLTYFGQYRPRDYIRI